MKVFRNRESVHKSLAPYNRSENLQRDAFPMFNNIKKVLIRLNYQSII